MMNAKRVIFTGWVTAVLIFHATLLPAGSFPPIRFVKAVTEQGGAPLFRDPLQMSLAPSLHEVAVTNSGSGDIVLLRVEDEKVLLRITGRSGLRPPFGIHLNPDKTILAGELTGREGLKLFDPTGRLLDRWDLIRACGYPIRPGRIRATGDGGTLVVERLRDRVLVLGPKGKLRKIIGKEEKLDQVQDAAPGPGGRRFFVLCNGGKAVRVFSGKGRFLYAFGRHAASPDSFSFPCALSFDRRGRLWVVDAFQHRLKVFSPEGKFLFQFGGLGMKPDQFFFPVDLAFAGRSRLWVLEKGANRIKIYDVEDLK